MTSNPFSTSLDDAISDDGLDPTAPAGLVHRARRKLSELTRALEVFRGTTPDVRGVVLSTHEGIPLAYDLPVELDVQDLANAAVAQRDRTLADAGDRRPAEAPASAFYPTEDGGRVLVVFLDGGFLLGADLAPDADPENVEWGAFDVGDSLMKIVRN